MNLLSLQDADCQSYGEQQLVLLKQWAAHVGVHALCKVLVQTLNSLLQVWWSTAVTDRLKESTRDWSTSNISLRPDQTVTTFVTTFSQTFVVSRCWDRLTPPHNNVVRWCDMLWWVSQHRHNIYFVLEMLWGCCRRLTGHVHNMSQQMLWPFDWTFTIEY